MPSEELKNSIKSNEEFEKEITNLQVCGYCLTMIVKEMSWSWMKKYLINETKKMSILGGINSLYQLKDKISMIIIMIEDQSSVDEVLILLEEMKIGVNNLINYVKEIGKK